jgi:hypothetical protein
MPNTVSMPLAVSNSTTYRPMLRDMTPFLLNVR